jgi:hypothetical protein
MKSTYYSCQILTKFDFSLKDFFKNTHRSNFTNPSSGNKVVQCNILTDKNAEGNSHFSEIHECT